MKKKVSIFFLCKKIFNKYKNIWSIEKSFKYRSIRFQNKKQIKISRFAKVLRTKQNLKFFYCNIQEKSFKKILKIAIKSPTKTLDRFISILEKRLDVVLFKSCFIFSLYQAKQLINHGNIRVNFKTFFNINKKVKKFDLISLNFYRFKVWNKTFFDFNNKLFSKSVPTHLEICFKSLTVCFLWSPVFFELFFPIKNDFSLVTRFYI
jgi:small subunit ribosomal protein S4